MALTAIFTKQGRNLIADESVTIEGMEKIKNGQQVKAIITVPRNLKQHRLLFALLNLVMQGQPEPAPYPTTESLLTALKYATSHVHKVKDDKGGIHMIPKSMQTKATSIFFVPASNAKILMRRVVICFF